MLVKRVSKGSALGCCEKGVIGVVAGGGFKECEGGADEFVEDGEDNGYRGFARGAQTLGEGCGTRVVTHGGAGWEVEFVAQFWGGVADAGGLAQGGAALALARDHAEPGGAAGCSR